MNLKKHSLPYVEIFRKKVSLASFFQTRWSLLCRGMHSSTQSFLNIFFLNLKRPKHGKYINTINSTTTKY